MYDLTGYILIIAGKDIKQLLLRQNINTLSILNSIFYRLRDRSHNDLRVLGPEPRLPQAGVVLRLPLGTDFRHRTERWNPGLHLPGSSEWGAGPEPGAEIQGGVRSQQRDHGGRGPFTDVVSIK